MAEIAGGSIKYTAEMDVSGLTKGLKDGEKGLKGFTDVVKESGSDVDDFLNVTKENIKIQKQYIQELEGKYKELQKTIDGMAPSKAKLSVMGEAADIARDIELEKKALLELQSAVADTETKHVTLQTKMRAVREEMMQLALAGQKDSKAYADLRDQSVAYQNELQEMNKELNALSGSTGITALVNSLGLLSGGLSTANGLVALFSGNNENLDRIMVHLQSTMSIAIGIQQVQNSLSKESGVIQSVVAVQTLARAKAETLATRGTIGATIAQRAFNLVANANPYVLLATALVTVVGALVIFSGKTKKAVNDQRDLNKAIKDGIGETSKEMVKLEVLYKTATNDKLSREQRLKATKDLVNAYPGLLSNIDKEVIMNGKAEKSYLAVRDAVLESAKAKAAQGILEKRMSEHLLEQEEIQERISDATARRNKIKGDLQSGKTTKTIKVDGGDGRNMSVELNNEVLLDNARNEIKNLEKIKQDGIKTYEKNNRHLLDVIQKGNTAYDKAVNEPEAANPNKTTTKTAKNVADEFLPPGSVAEIQKRLSEIDKLLSKATGDKQIADLKSKRIALAKDLVEAEKKIQIQSLQQQFSESQKLWSDYHSAIESLGKPTADKIYGDLLANDSSQFEQLQKKQQELLAKANTTDKDGKSLITDEEKEVLSKVSQIINEMLGKQSQLDQFKQGVADALSTMATEAEKLQYLTDKKNTASKDTREYAYVVEQERAIQEQLKQQYQQFLNDHRSFEEQKAEISAHYAMIRQKIIDDELLTQAQKNKKLKILEENKSNEIAKAFMNGIAGSEAWKTNFDNLTGLAFAQFARIRAELIKQLNDLKKQGIDESSPEFQKILERLRELDGVADKSPFTKLANDWKKFQEAMKDGDNSIKGIAGKVAEGAKLVNGAISTGLGIAKELGIQFSEETQAIINDIQTTIGGIEDLASGIVTLNPGQIIKGIGGIVKGIAGLFNKDKKKERNIKKWAAEVEALKVKYEELQRAMAKALGEGTYKAQADQIRNLQQQQQKLQMMINEEGKKKKKDNGKIQDMQNQIVMINSMIDDIRDNIIKDVLQTDVKQLASGLADALISAFEKGEDAAKSLDKVANDVFKNMVKNALQMRMQNALKPILDDILAAAGFDKEGKGSFRAFTPEQLAEFKKRIAEAGLAEMDFLKSMGSLFDDGVSASNLEGAIKGVSEETASIIAGQMNAIRIMQGESIKLQQNSFSLMQQQLSQLMMIEFNTRYLKLIYAAMGKSSNDDLRASGLI